MRLAHMTVAQAEQYFKSRTIAILPIGSIECHGSHNVLGVDTLIPEKLTELIEAKSDVMIAPMIPYGACDSQTGFPGTISLGTDVLYQVIKRVVDGLYGFGIRRFAFLNGHGGNIPALDRICLELDQKGALGAELNWWLMAWDLNPAWKGGHGGAEETAAMMAIDPALVHMDQVQEMGLIDDLSPEMRTKGFSKIAFEGVEIPVPRYIERYTKNGWIGPDHPKEATEAWGKEMLQATADYIIRFVAAFEKI